MPNGNGGSGGGFDFGGFLDGLLAELTQIIQAIIQFLYDLVKAIASALNFLFSGIEDSFGFSFKSLSEVWNGLQKLMDKIFKQVIIGMLLKLYDLYKKLAAWAAKLKAWLDKLHALMKKYQMMYFRKVIQLIQRARKILAIFRFFHLKFAQKLDNWLAKIEGKITHYLLIVAQKTNEIISWVDFIVDPRGALKLFPLVAGFFAALNVTWSGIFGTGFQGLGGTGTATGPSTPMTQAFAQTVADENSSSGTAADLHSRFNGRQARFDSAAGF